MMEHVALLINVVCASGGFGVGVLFRNWQLDRQSKKAS